MVVKEAVGAYELYEAQNVSRCSNCISTTFLGNNMCDNI